MAILVTGAAGFVALNVAEHLLSSGRDVVGLDRIPLPPRAAQAFAALPGRFTLVDASYSFTTLVGAEAITGGAYPAHVASLRAMVPLKEGLVRLSGQGIFQSARRAQDGSAIGEAFLLNFGLSGEYGPVRYFAGVQNLLDQRYVVPVLSEIAFSKVPQYGRTFFIEVAAGF